MNSFCLWINGKKINTPEGIMENFNISDIRGYYLGGQLSNWLRNAGAEKLADAVDNIPKNENPDKSLYEIFGNNYKAPDYHKGTPVPSSFSSPCSYNSSYSFSASSYKLSSSFNASSFNNTSFKNIFTSGSYRTAFTSGKFSVLGSFGSYKGINAGSFKNGSFVLPPIEIYEKSLNDKSSFFCFGSYNHFAELYASFISEPLNQYGYGINII